MNHYEQFPTWDYSKAKLFQPEVHGGIKINKFVKINTEQK